MGLRVVWFAWRKCSMDKTQGAISAEEIAAIVVATHQHIGKKQ